MKKRFFLLGIVAFIGLSKLGAQETLKGSIQMRATNSPLTTHPLVLVDGFETDMESMVLSPNNIEAITILKDQGATDKYGEKAKDGAIIITTKPGTRFKKITDFVDASKNLNKSISKIELNGKTIANADHLLIDNSALINTMISADLKVDDNCNMTSVDMLVISTNFPEDRKE